jgi:hypothetical protein
MPRNTIDSLRQRVDRHYQWCVKVLEGRDLDGFLDWLGPDGTFPAADGSIIRVADTRPFWEWRFDNVLAVRRVEIQLRTPSTMTTDCWSSTSTSEPT